MALKRSGVRASFAPYHRSGFPCRGRSAIRSVFLDSFRFLFLLCISSLLAVAPGRSQQSSPQTGPSTPTDVFLFIHQTSPGSARIGLSYRKIVPHTQVQSEIKKLLAVSGWKLSGAPAIADKSVRPDNPVRFPPKTGVEFSVSGAPQFHDNAPMLAPYLRAFQAWDHLEILFVTSDLVPYNGVTNFRSPEVDVTLAKTDGIYDYLVAIHEHSKDLPALIPDAPNTSNPIVGKTSSSGDGQNPPEANGPIASKSPALFLPYLFILIGSVLAGGVGLYLLARRHQENLKLGRTR